VGELKQKVSTFGGASVDGDPMSGFHRTPRPFVFGFIFLVAACGTADDGAGSEAISTSTSTTTMAHPTTTSAMITTTQMTVTSLPRERFVPDQTNLIEPPSLPDSGGALGSGCSPGADLLPDGVWAGWVIEREPDQVQFDLACMWAGPEEPVLQNQSNRLRSIPVSPAALVHTTEEGGPIPYAQWKTMSTSVFCADVMITPAFPSGCPIWLYVNNGAITEITEFFLP
jgi:hypothetical protein